jgi:hypothetical protein
MLIWDMMLITVRRFSENGEKLQEGWIFTVIEGCGVRLCRAEGKEEVLWLEV